MRTLSLILLAALAGCRSTPAGPDLGLLYNRAAQVSDRLRNPVIVIPGILGSKLAHRETGQVVWGAFTSEAADPETSEGARLIGLPMAEDAPLSRLTNDVDPVGVLDSLRVELLGLPIEVNAYFHILATLGVGGYRDQQLGEAGAVEYGEGHFTCFQFAYDWRRCNAENAARLKAFIVERRKYIEDEFDRRGWERDGPIKFDIVAHSMGGLITRYFLRYGDQALPADGSLPELTWEGAEYVDRAILVGTPNGGSANAALSLTEGVHYSRILPSFPAAILGTMPAIYQLLPRERQARVRADGKGIRLYDPAVWELRGWGLADPKQAEVLELLLPDLDAAARRRVAIDHQRKCLETAERFHRAMDRPADAPPGLLYLFVGDSVPTAEVLEVNAEGRLVATDFGAGDGTVTRWSALWDETVGAADETGRLKLSVRWSQVQFLPSDHIGLTKSPTFTDNVLYLLLLDPRK